MRYILAKDVFYRQFKENTVVYKTSKKKTYIFDGVAFEILNSFKNYLTVEDIINILVQKYCVVSEDIREGIQAFCDKLAEEEILKGENILFEEKNSIEYQVRSSLLEDFQLYNVQFELTFNCNEKCRHCYCLQNDPRAELSLAEIRSILDELAEMNVFQITFTGGDLFTRKDTFDILRYAYEKNFLIDIFTNGIALSDNDFFKLKELYPRSIHFSVYSHIAEKHDSFTQVKGSFERTMAAIKKCMLLDIPVNIKTNVMEYNADEIEDIIELAENLGTTIQLSMAVNAKNDGDMSPTRLRLNSAEDYADIMRKVNKHIEVHCGGDLMMKRTPTGQICGAGYNGLNINPYGDVFPCNALLIKCGNVRDTGIKDIWMNSKQLEQIRSFRMNQVKGCEDCRFLEQCNFCPGSALQETGDALQKYNEVCVIAKAKELSEK